MEKLDSILGLVQREFGHGRGEILAPSRSRKGIAWARQVAMYLAHTVPPGASFTEVGRAFGRDRTTVAHACRKVEDHRDLEDFDALLEKLEGEINGSTAATVHA